MIIRNYNYLLIRGSRANLELLAHIYSTQKCNYLKNHYILGQ